MLIDPTDDLRGWISAAYPDESSYLDGLPRDLLLTLYPNTRIVGVKADNVATLVRLLNEQPRFSRRFKTWALSRGVSESFSEDWGIDIVNYVTGQVMSQPQFQVTANVYDHTFKRVFSRAARGYLLEEWLDLETPHKWEARQESARAFRLLANSYGIEISRPRELPSLKHHLTAEAYEIMAAKAKTRRP